MDDERTGELEPVNADTEAEAVDLNKVFREEELDLNSMFPDGEMRDFLRQIRRNRRSNRRFLEGFRKDRFWDEEG